MNKDGVGDSTHGQEYRRVETATEHVTEECVGESYVVFDCVRLRSIVFDCVDCVRLCSNCVQSHTHTHTHTGTQLGVKRKYIDSFRCDLHGVATSAHDLETLKSSCLELYAKYGIETRKTLTQR